MTFDRQYKCNVPLDTQLALSIDNRRVTGLEMQYTLAATPRCAFGMQM